MRYLLSVLLLTPCFFAQDMPANTIDRSGESEDHRAIRSRAQQEMEETEQQILVEEEQWKRAQGRVSDQLEQLEETTKTIEEQTDSLLTLMETTGKQDKGPEVTISKIQIDHWNSRNPRAAAEDFALLYKLEPEVGKGIVKGMKKKKSAALIDAVSSLNRRGKEVAAELHKAIGGEGAVN